MDLNKVKALMDLLEQSNLHKLSVKEEGGFEVHLEKSPAPPAHAGPAIEVPHMKKELHHPLSPHEKNEQVKEGTFIESPMVGTFYAAPSPGSKPFIKPGDAVKPQSIVCIIEAMKVMNEVKAGKEGIIREILVEDASPVEFGTKLMRIE